MSGKKGKHDGQKLLSNSYFRNFGLTAGCRRQCLAAQPEEGVLPEDTVLHLELRNFLDTKRNKVGDEVDVMLLEPVKLGETVIIPKGTMLAGTLKKVQKGTGCCRSGALSGCAAGLFSAQRLSGQTGRRRDQIFGRYELYFHGGGRSCALCGAGLQGQAGQLSAGYEV